ncbi:MAG: acetyl-CoA hydrolase/transferase C-terminal domain-containing protein, partial [Halieaceae bacterium]|nr:acetyl-CoA hydrolase/transferase C-terminal domain-containing protein [Halieaceae bacterium]
AVCGEALQGHLRHRVFFAGKDTRDLINAGLADYVPIFLSELPKLFRRGEQRVDTALIQVSSPDQHGNCTLGISVEATKAACEVADRVIAHINPSMPRTHGDAFIPLDDIDIAYVEDGPLITIDPRPASEVTAQIGRHIASLIGDGDCLQMGIGAIPDAALSNLEDRRHLGVHTEMFSDGLLPLVECGAVDNSLKKRQRGKIVTGFAMGSEALYRFVDDNPEVIFLDIEYVNDPTEIARNKQVVSINSAIQIDLSGQVCADSMGPRVYSGVGGQVDFVLGAAFSEGGKSIIALPSTARDGKYTRLVTMLTRGSGVVTTRAHVDYIVTEYGIARLRGRSVTERARELIAIAHPDFRETLQREAHEQLGLQL